MITDEDTVILRSPLPLALVAYGSTGMCWEEIHLHRKFFKKVELTSEKDRMHVRYGPFQNLISGFCRWIYGFILSLSNRD